jgi:hypothetical protein
MLFACLESMLRVSPKIFIILDALDECPVNARESDILPFLQRLVDLEIHGLHLFVTSRPERDIRRRMDMFSSHFLDLHSASEHDDALAHYVSTELSSERYRAHHWPLNIKDQAEKALSKKAKGM